MDNTQSVANGHQTKDKPTRGLTNREVRKYVAKRLPFENNNKTLFGEWVTDDTYAVYSYGRHWPLFVWERTTERWYENEEKYSVTTTRHRTHTNPTIYATDAKSTIPVSLAFIRKLSVEGYPAIAAARVIHGAFDEVFG